MLETVAEQKAFGGTQGVYRHSANSTACTMEFSVFTPPGEGPFAVLWYLSGLTCTQENATTKAGFQRMAAELGIMVICPDTSPRGAGVADDDGYDLGQGAGFYVNATEAPWAAHYRMDDYVSHEMPELIAKHFPADIARQSITGHSMGGHGALTMAFRNPVRYRSVSAFAPIVAPTQCPWGEKAFGAYLGSDRSAWRAYDACELVRDRGAQFDDILIDQGLADNFLEDQLKPGLFEKACAAAGQSLTLRRHAGYDHSYYLMATFMGDHLRFHAARLNG